MTEFIDGIQVGAINQSRRTRGSQIGLGNSSAEMVGLQIGFLNIIQNPSVFPTPVMPLMNLSW